MANTSTKKLQQKTKSTYLVLRMIDQSCQGVLNTQFSKKGLDPVPDWFDGLDQKLKDSQGVAGDWLNNLGPSIAGGVPAKVVSYSTTYQALSASIQKIADEHPNAQGADNQYVKEVHSLVEGLEGSVSDILKQIDETATQMTDWGKRLQKAHDALSDGATSIQAAETDLQTDIDKMNNAISNLRSAIHKENIAIAASAGGIGLGLLLTVVGIALAPETGGTSLLVAAGGGLLVVGGAVTWGVMQHKINEQFDEIGKDQKELEADKRQLVALQGLATAAKGAVDYMEQAQTYLTEFRTEWSTFQQEITSVKDKLQKADESLQVIVSAAFTQAALNEWLDAEKFANQIATAGGDAKTESATMSMSGDIIKQSNAA
ncbi:MAG TPA: hypothetical protein DCE42_16900 [Myxococcales bacterium]|nr:hypothetical protein [Deltaproteobacteria bacterium]HAA56447.1 hypothetical protein [Myxococcales bacterium]